MDGRPAVARLMEAADRLARRYRTGCGLLLTTGPDGSPHAAFTWIGLAAGGEGRAIADWPSTSLTNVRANPRAALQIIGPDNLLFLLKGTATVAGYHEFSSTLRFALLHVRVTDVKDQSWPLVRVAPLSYTWTDPAMAQIEREVLRLLELR